MTCSKSVAEIQPRDATCWRAHLDGLRGIAILAVGLNHLGFKWIPGGFTGVDLFFVLSGYLIIRGLIQEQRSIPKALKAFFDRRARRILPAFFMVAISYLIVGALFFPASGFTSIASSVTYATLFCANLALRGLATGYFGADMAQQPILHLWSLGVEEQFYLFFPLLILLLRRLSPRARLWLLIAMAGASFTGATYALTKGRVNDAFYLPHLRAWEFLAGGILAQWHEQKRSNLPLTNGPLGRLSQILGFILITVPLFTLGPNATFPGWNALSTVFGAILLIDTGHFRPFSFLLTNKPLTWVGKLSYGLYLWHWPVLVMWRHVHDKDPDTWQAAGLIGLIVTLTVLSWYLVEQPLRSSKKWQPKHSLMMALTGIFLLGGGGVVVGFFRGWPGYLHPLADAIPDQYLVRDPAPVRGLVRGMEQLQKVSGKSWSLLSRRDSMIRDQDPMLNLRVVGDQLHLGVPGIAPTILLVGDSHAQAQRYGWDKVLAEHHQSGLSIARASTDFFDLSKPEAQVVVKALTNLSSIQTVVVAQQWIRHTPTPDPFDEESKMFFKLETFVRELKSMNRKVFILEDIPRFKFSYVLEAPKRIALGQPYTPADSPRYQQTIKEYNQKQGGINESLKSICERTGENLISLPEILTEGSVLNSALIIDGKPTPLFYDTHHLSRVGSIQAAEFVLGHLNII